MLRGEDKWQKKKQKKTKNPQKHTHTKTDFLYKRASLNSERQDFLPKLKQSKLTI